MAEALRALIGMEPPAVQFSKAESAAYGPRRGLNPPLC